MSRLRTFLRFQSSAWRALLRIRKPAVVISTPPDRITHPSQLCRCFGRPANASHDVLADHNPGCPWVAAMCEGCAGTRWCIKCGGDGTRPDWDPDATPVPVFDPEPTKRERPSAKRVA